jgi:hypothetical protein
MKKKIITFSILLLVAAGSFAQLEKGRVMLTGSISANYDDNVLAGRKTDAQGGMGLEFMIGYVMDKGWVIGGGTHYRNHFDTDFDAAGDKYSRQIVHSIGPLYFFRKYTRITDKFYFRAGFIADYLANMHYIRYFPSDSKTDVSVYHSVDLRARVAVAYFPDPRWALEFSYGELGYHVDFDNVISGTKYVSNHFRFKYGLDGIEVSLTYFFNRKPKEEKR